MKLVGNKEMIIPVKIRKSRLYISSFLTYFTEHDFLFLCVFLKWCWRRAVFLSHQVIGMLPGKGGQAPFVTCGAKVIPFCLSQ